MSHFSASEMNPPHFNHPRILFYAVDGLGLGHVTRLLAIARAIRAQREGAQILFVTTTEADSVIYKEGFASVKIPSRSIVAESRLRPSTYNKLAHSVVMNTVAAFNPAVLVADSFPAGISQELMPTLSWEMRRVFVYRNQQIERANDPFFQQVLEKYDLGIVPHEEGSQTIPAPASLKLVWTGPIMIRDLADALPRVEARRRLNLPKDGRLLYVTVGGGGDDEMAQAEGLIFDTAKLTGWTTVAPDAPLHKTESGEIRHALPDHRISYYPMAECLNAFDGAISAAGYNSVHELLHFGTPTLFIPRERSLDDQFARAKWAESTGAALTGTLNPADLKKSILSLSNPKLRTTIREKAMALVPTSGAKMAAEKILGLL